MFKECALREAGPQCYGEFPRCILLRPGTERACRPTRRTLFFGAVFVAASVSPFPIRFEENKKAQPNAEDGRPSTADTGEAISTEKIGDEQTAMISTSITISNAGSIFIPLGWARESPVTLYKGDDPEWQEFLKLNRNVRRMEELKRMFKARDSSILVNL